jgi:hypothetical protein
MKRSKFSEHQIIAILRAMKQLMLFGNLRQRSRQAHPNVIGMNNPINDQAAPGIYGRGFMTVYSPASGRLWPWPNKSLKFDPPAILSGNHCTAICDFVVSLMPF